MAAFVLLSLGSIAAIVTAIVSTIEDDDRRFAVEMTISVIIWVTTGGCGILGLTHNAQAPDIAPPVQIELRGTGRIVVLEDTDTQQTAATSARDRTEHGGLLTIHCVERYDNTSSELIDLDGRYGYVVVDAAGRDSGEWDTCMAVADLLIVPFRTSQIDLDNLPHLNEVASGVKN